jgi:hypothetical protein
MLGTVRSSAQVEPMQLREFHIGLEFWMSGARRRCTDVGTRTVIAIKLEAPDESWYNGPPYAVAESVLDEDDLPACSTMKDQG